MALVYESKGVRFHIFPNDHSPPHCHVIHKDWELKLDLTEDYRVLYINGKPSKADIKEAQRIARENKFEMGKAWRKYHGS